MTPEAKRRILRDMIYYIRFPLMTLEDFKDEIIKKNPGILSESEITTLLAYFNVEPGKRYELTLLYNNNKPLSIFNIARLNFPTEPFNSQERLKLLCRVNPYIQQNPDGSSRIGSCRSTASGTDRKVCEGTFGWAKRLIEIEIWMNIWRSQYPLPLPLSISYETMKMQGDKAKATRQ